MLQLDLPGLAAAQSLRAAADHLLANALECRIDTAIMHQRHVRMLLEWFGADTPVTAIGYPELRRYYVEEQRRGMSRETIRKRLSTLHMVLAEAERQGWVPRVPPWVVIKTDSRPAAGFWTLVQWQAVNLACDDEDLRTWIALGFWFGLHTRDLNSYRWCDVDLVRRTWVRRNHKTGVTPIELPLPNQLQKLLRERHDQLQPHRRDLICARNLGNPNRAIKALCLRAGVTVISPIGLRHSCETFLDESGTTELFQQTWMGLRSPAMLKRHYRHVTPRVLDGGIAAINAR
jgi:integrase